MSVRATSSARYVLFRGRLSSLQQTVAFLNIHCTLNHDATLYCLFLTLTWCQDLHRVTIYVYEDLEIGDHSLAAVFLWYCPRPWPEQALGKEIRGVSITMARITD